MIFGVTLNRHLTLRNELNRLQITQGSEGHLQGLAIEFGF